MTALQLLAIDPGLGGIWLRARVGPPRDAFIAAAKSGNPRPFVPITPAATDEALFGGLDVTQTLAHGKPRYAKGLLGGDPCLIALSSAERTPPDLAARLAQHLDKSPRDSLLALDEGIDDEATPHTLTDRLAFHISLEDLRACDCPLPDTKTSPIKHATATIDDTSLRDLITLAAQLGVHGLRAPIFAIRAAKASAILNGRREVVAADLEEAAALVLGPRATIMPAEAPPPPEKEHKPDESPDEIKQSPTQPPEDMLLEAALAALPPDILARLASGTGTPRASGQSAYGARKKGNHRGRPLSPRKGKPDARQRIDLIATLREAAPWQTVRRKGDKRKTLHIRPEDIHLRRYQSRSDRLLIFAVDASGSAAINRLAEAKGAVELMLAEAYANRDHVALISYNKTGAELLLPPTRSLVQTKRRLAKLPGGGGTPLAAGLQEAIQTALRARQKGFQPAIIVIADGRANIDLTGTADRPQALADALQVAKTNRVLGTPGIVIDMSKRPEPQLKNVSEAMNASYIPLPFVDARRLSDVVTSQLGPA